MLLSSSASVPAKEINSIPTPDLVCASYMSLQAITATTIAEQVPFAVQRMEVWNIYTECKVSFHKKIYIIQKMTKYRDFFYYFRLH
jgi:hypothetical protein